LPPNQTGGEPASNHPENQQAQTIDAVERDLNKFERKILTATWVGVIAAAITGAFIYSQFRAMTDQNQILSSQSIAAVAGAIESERITREQLRIAQAQAEAAKVQGQIMRQQLDLSERPWIVSEFAPTYFQFKEDGGFLGLRITLTNIGHSTAESITAWTTLSVNDRTWVAEGETNCGYPKLPVNKNDRAGAVLFPGQQYTFEQPAVARKEAIEKALANGDFKDMHMVSIHVLTCIDYRYKLDSRHHQTRKFFALVRPDPVTHVFMGVFDPHGNYDLSAFRMLPGGWDQAD
jgi:hypothetical protein